MIEHRTVELLCRQLGAGVPTQMHDIIISMRKYYLNFHFEYNVCGNDRSAELVSFGHDYILYLADRSETRV